MNNCVALPRQFAGQLRVKLPRDTDVGSPRRNKPRYERDGCTVGSTKPPQFLQARVRSRVSNIAQNKIEDISNSYGEFDEFLRQKRLDLGPAPKAVQPVYFGMVSTTRILSGSTSTTLLSTIVYFKFLASGADVSALSGNV